MAELSTKQKELLRTMEDLRSEYEQVTDDCSIKSFPKAFERINDQFDELIQKVEDGEFMEEAETKEEESADSD